jgi:endonuclease/exonuclease/phosphatase family metal-dependent hydrolase
MVLSRYPIAQAEFVRRHRAPGSQSVISEKACLCTDIAVPNRGIVRLINLHLTVGGVLRNSHRPQKPAQRFTEIDEILDIARDPHRPPALLLGDFNCGPTVNSDVYERIIAAGFSDAFTAAVLPGNADAITWDQNNSHNATGRHRHAPSQRIDHVFVPSSLAMSIVPLMTRIEFDKATVDVGRERRVTLSDHYGLSVNLGLRLKNGRNSVGPALVPTALPKQALPELVHE